MSANERIEELLNRCGQTIADLPKASDDAYSTELKLNARNFLASEGWTPVGYVLHLTDVIDRMEIALNNVLARSGKDVRP